MTRKQRHEYELKFKIGTDKGAMTQARQRLHAAGFTPTSRTLETDYLPDSADDACKKAKMLLRFRLVQTATAEQLLLTLKIKQSDNNILHFHEYETDLYRPDQDIIALINEALQSRTGLTLDQTALHSKTLAGIRRAAAQNGFTKHRILLSKYRENFSSGEDNATIDYFPDDMGVFIELESHTAKALRRSVRQVGFNPAEGITTDYGDLLKLHKAGQQDQNQRTALFSDIETSSLRRLFQNETSI